MSCRWRSSGEETGKGGANEADARQVWRFRRETAQTAEHKNPENTLDPDRKHFCMYLRVFSGVCVLPPSVFQQLYHAQALISASSLIHTWMKDPGNVLVFLSEQFAASHSHLGASRCCEVQRAASSEENASSRHFHTFK